MILARGRSLKSSSLRQQHSGTTSTPTGNASYSPKASTEIKFNPRSRSPTPSPVSKVQTNQPSPIHPRGCGYSSEAFRERQDDRKNQGHPLPLPPSPPNSPPKHLLRNNSANEGVLCLHSRWKKGKLLGRGTFGHVYAGFNRYLQFSLWADSKIPIPLSHFIGSTFWKTICSLFLKYV